MTRQQRWQIDNPVKDRAHNIVKSCVRTGLIKKPDNCEECGENAFLTSHHPDYKKPRNVEWLCRPCHKNRHRTFPNRRASYESILPKNLIRLREAATILGVKSEAIRHQIKTGELRGRKFGVKLLVIEKGDLEKHINNQIEKYLQALKRVRGRR